MKNHDHVVTVDKNRHAKLRVKPNPDFAHAKSLNMAAVSLGELSACTGNFPVIFVHSPDNTSFRPVTLFGLRPGENVYYGQDGWDCTYVPLMIHRHPFLIGFDDREADSKILTICLDKLSPFLSEDAGIPMFDEAGVETDFLNVQKRLLAQIYEGEKVTEKFTQKLLEMDLLSPVELIMQPQNEEVRKVAGMYTIDESKLRALRPEQVQELHKLDFLPACYIILASLFQVHNLMKLRHRKTGQFVNYRIDLPQPGAANAGVPVA